LKRPRKKKNLRHKCAGTNQLVNNSNSQNIGALVVIVAMVGEIYRLNDVMITSKQICWNFGVKLVKAQTSQIGVWNRSNMINEGHLRVQHVDSEISRIGTVEMVQVFLHDKGPLIVVRNNLLDNLVWTCASTWWCG